MFEPPRCPRTDCPRHADPGPAFYTRHGAYRALCRPHPIPRFRCKTCRRTFSRQTFRADCGDHKPHLNARVIQVLCSGVGLRQSARILSLTRRSLEAKSRKISRNASWLDKNVKARGARDAAPLEVQEIHFDEFETYETRRNTRPLTLALVLETEARLIVDAVAAPIRPSGKMTPARLAAIAADEARFGPRRDRSDVACRWALRSAARLRPASEEILVHTDLKSTYGGLIRHAYRDRRVVHHKTSSKIARTVANPLFAINHTEACLRDHAGRLRRESWLVSKLRKYLNLYLRLIMAWKNWVRPRFNYDEKSPGQIAGLAPRRLEPGELAGWRQDWGAERSPCPFKGL